VTLRASSTTGSTLIRSLLAPARYDHPVERVELVETHISWVLLTGPYAYKIKKPVNLGFLDFSTLEKRRHYCQEELRLNRRLAPQLYLDVVPISGTPEAPTWGPPSSTDGPVIDYAVKMRQFPQAAQLDRVAAHGGLGAAVVDQLAAALAAFHAAAAVAPAASPFGAPEGVAQPIRENFTQLEECLADEADRSRHRRLQAWSEADLAAHRDALLRRKAEGFVRECHGDLHLANMVLLDGRVVIFDCLEFSEPLRWIDVMSEIAFLCMDLDDRGHAPLAHRLLNDYLEESGDYAGLGLFRTYRVYRALVRAKVACIRWRQTASDHGEGSRERQRLRQEYQGYTELAERYTQPPRPFMVIMHGPSGSGKTVISGQLVEACGAVRVRSDVERKRLFGLEPLARSGSELDRGLYSQEAGRRTYERLADLAGTILRAGSSVIVDGAFLRRDQRDRLRAVAEACGVPAIILDLRAPAAVLRERVARRAREGRDASEAGREVLERQLAGQDALAPDEQAHTLTVPTEPAVALAPLRSAIERATGGR
jgi:hypothetical protein